MYALIDSGEGEKLEQFGDRILIRPSRYCIWRKRSPQSWKNASAIYDHKEGWRFYSNKFSEWETVHEDLKYSLRLQKNGQVGIFPEHFSYFHNIKQIIAERGSSKVLNLFAYTGAASVVCAKLGAKVTHVDISESALTWAKENFILNKVEDSVRLIKEDSISFLKKESKRENKYSLIIADPPSFSRVSAKSSWDILDIFSELLHEISNIIEPNGFLILTSHHAELADTIMAGLVGDIWGDSSIVENYSLQLKERDTLRKIPAGFIVLAKKIG